MDRKDKVVNVLIDLAWINWEIFLRIYGLPNRVSPYLFPKEREEQWPASGAGRLDFIRDSPALSALEIDPTYGFNKIAC